MHAPRGICHYTDRIVVYPSSHGLRADVLMAFAGVALVVYPKSFAELKVEVRVRGRIFGGQIGSLQLAEVFRLARHHSRPVRYDLGRRRDVSNARRGKLLCGLRRCSGGLHSLCLRDATYFMRA